MQRESKKQARGPRRDESRPCCTVISAVKQAAPRFRLRDAHEPEDDDAPPQPAALEGDLDFASLFAWPLDRTTFMEEYWQLKALLIKGDGQQRLDASVVSDYLLDLDLERLLDHTPSDSIHVWLAQHGNKTGKVESIKVNEPAVALACHRAGASLYFRAPQPLADALVSAAFLSLGASFSGWQPDGSMRGEIETFVSRAGHVTAWHWDFMENFTFQLKGSKRWLLKAADVTVPLRGCTPHFRIDATVREMQIVTARMTTDGPAFSFHAPNPDEVSEVVLNEGDVFYFPSGMYHQVECIEDSVSINCSLEPCKFAEYLSHATNHLLCASTAMREHMVGSPEQLRVDMAHRLEAFKALVNAMSVDMLLPPALFRTEAVPHNVVSSKEGVEAELHKKTPLRKNPLAVMFSASDVASLGDADGSEHEAVSDDGGGADSGVSYVVQFNCGADEFVPWLRSVIQVAGSDDLEALQLIAERAESGASFSVADLRGNNCTLAIAKLLLHRGYLIKA